ncbi:MAG: hypothetical protein HUJ26_05060 [Planctomycetaceae bacterium]|nr:hypothetical protein [Planctomycetaceae bacterium]
MSKQHFRLAATEAVVSQMANQLYAAYISTGKVSPEESASWMERSIEEAIAIAKTVDESFQSEQEIS